MSEHHEEITAGPLNGSMGKAETIRRLCRILYLVHDKRIGFGEGPCDCCCTTKFAREENWRSTGEALRWLEMFVQALPRHGREIRVTERWRINQYGETKYEKPAIEAERGKP